MTGAGRTTTLRQLPDLLDFLDALNEAKAKYLVIDRHAVGLHGHSRATKDLDVWIGEDVTNREAVLRALRAFGAPETAIRNLVSASKDEFVFLGRPPQRIDLLQSIPGVEDFEGGYSRRACVRVEGVDVIRLEKVRTKELELGGTRAPSRGRGRDDSSR